MSEIEENDKFDSVIVPADVEEAESDPTYKTLAAGFLSPRHRRLAQLAASGMPNKQICKELGYVDSRVSILLKNPHIVAEIARLQDRLFEETIKDRLKQMTNAALDNVHMILTDKTNRVRVSEKADMSKWVIEKLDGKATQTHDVGENTLAIFMDKLDAAKTAGALTHTPRPAIDVTHSVVEGEAPKKSKDEEELLADWVTDYNQGS